jgi:uncharacterized hydantoinase/oxoprolinase family protein
MSEETLLKRLVKEEVERFVERVMPPEVLATLDDIARGIMDIKKKLEAQVPEGLKEELTVQVEGTRATPITPRTIMPPYVRATCFCDGPDPVYVFLNKPKPEAFRQAPLNPGDKIDIDTTEAKIEALYFACTTPDGKASVRVHLLK